MAAADSVAVAVVRAPIVVMPLPIDGMRADVVDTVAIDIVVAVDIVAVDIVAAVDTVEVAIVD